MILIHKSEPERNFTMVPNSLLEDMDLSLKATALLIYALSKPVDWKVRVKDITKRFTDGKSAVYSGLKELEEKGYIIRVQDQENDGKFTEVVYHVFDSPRSAESDTEPLTENRETVPLTENRKHSNTDIYNNINNTKKEREPSAPAKRSKNSSRAVLKDPSFKRELTIKFGLNPVLIGEELEKMVDWLDAKGEKRKDYKAFARGWIRRTEEYKAKLEKKKKVTRSLNSDMTAEELAKFKKEHYGKE